ncbi:hypothetical protein PPGU19_026920 [Paraburkholderia sp. PGU19]|uniref:hypothetical protein n=1 Tax=Paraburkholderia sp. PGU19 TaxID=2735434 RepID=UPI0015D97FAC|nr:hypothetical protein [Paraburkholderia sp. PGU19]BCF98123.1 hypothetical protein PPGU19_026920 [Paraburkholderia sp. PGU19]
MEDRWADYLTYEARFDATQTRIIRLRLAIDNGIAVDESGEYLRQDVVSAIKGDSTFATVFQGPGTGDGTFGHQVFLAAVNGVEYVEIGESASEKDDLGDTPSF